MIVVIDTNVLVSGLLAPFGRPAEIVRLVFSGDLQPCYDSRVWSEYQDVFQRPELNIQPDEAGALLDKIQADGLSIVAVPLPSRLPDPDDEMFLEVAWAGKAECLITGNLRHFPESLRQGVRVVAPAEFIALYRRG